MQLGSMVRPHKGCLRATLTIVTGIKRPSGLAKADSRSSCVLTVTVSKPLSWCSSHRLVHAYLARTLLRLGLHQLLGCNPQLHDCSCQPSLLGTLLVYLIASSPRCLFYRLLGSIILCYTAAVALPVPAIDQQGTGCCCCCCCCSTPGTQQQRGC